MNWQPIIAGLIVLAAGIWICRRIYRTIASGLRSGNGPIGNCGTCTKNPKSAASSASPLIQLDVKRSDSSQSSDNRKTKLDHGEP